MRVAERGSRRLGRSGFVGLGASTALLMLLAHHGNNAAVGLAGTDVVGYSPGITYLLAGLAALIGAWSVACFLRATRKGWAPSAGLVTVLGLVAAFIVATEHPVGTADIGSYASYGSMEQRGIDSYSFTPRQDRFHPGSALAEDPWKDTPNVYGPLATWIFKQAADHADTLTGSIDGKPVSPAQIAPVSSPWSIAAHLQFYAFLAFALTGLLLLSCATTAAGKTRAALLWTCNPLLQLHLVSGAHVDVFVAMFVVLSVWLAKRPLLRGAAAGLAVATKATAGWAALGLVLGKPRRGRFRRLVAFVLVGGLLYSFASDHVFDQSRKASRFVSAGTPWRWVASLFETVLSHSVARVLVAMMALAATIAMSFAITVAFRYWPDKGTPERAARSALIPMLAWTFMAPYQLPWYDAVVWSLLAASVALGLDWVILLHTTVLTLAYLPGRVVPLGDVPHAVQTVLRNGICPLVVAFCAFACLVSLRRPQRDRAAEPA